MRVRGLLVGDSGSGKSRSLAQAARDAYGTHRLLRPAEHQLAQLAGLPLADLGQALVWLDDVEKYAQPALREILHRLLAAGMVIAGTIRRKELQALTGTGEIRNPSGEALSDERLVRHVAWKREWSQSERGRAAEHVTSPLALQAVAAGLPLGVWAVAGPKLVRRLDPARTKEDYRCRFALVRGARLVPHRHDHPTALADRCRPAQPRLPGPMAQRRRPRQCLHWCARPIGIGGRPGRYSLLTQQHDKLGVNDYVQDHDRRQDPPPIPDPTWTAALANVSDPQSLWNISITAYSAGQQAIAVKAMRTLADTGHSGAMFNLGVLLADQEPDEARRWFERAAERGYIEAMFNLDVLLAGQEPDEARCSLDHEGSCSAGSTGLEQGLGRCLGDVPLEAIEHHVIGFGAQRPGPVELAGVFGNSGNLQAFSKLADGATSNTWAYGFAHERSERHVLPGR